jgi:hypothetical protein
MTCEVIDAGRIRRDGARMHTTTTPQLDPARTVDGYLAAYSEPDGARRAELVAAVWAADGRLVDPPLTGEGHDGIGAMAAAVQQQFPGHVFRRASAVDAHHDAVRYAWELVAPDGAVALTGTDVGLLAPDGRLARVTGFFGELAPMEGERS